MMKIFQIITFLLIAILFSGCFNPDDNDSNNTDNLQNTEKATVLLSAKSELITTESGRSAIFSATLSRQPSSIVKLNLTISLENEALFKLPDNNATYSPNLVLIFTPDNWNVKQEIIIVGQDDNLMDDNQVYSIVLSSVETSDELFSRLKMREITLTNVDDDVVGISKLISGQKITDENGKSTQIAILLNSKPTDIVKILAVSNLSGEGMIRAGGELVSSQEMLFTPDNWSDPQLLTIVGQDDDIVDGTQEYSISISVISSEDAQYSALETEEIVLTNYDNDHALINVLLPSQQIQTTESGNISYFDIALSNKPTSPVNLTLKSSNIVEGLLSEDPATQNATEFVNLIFTPDDWNQEKRISIVGQDDSVADGDQLYAIEFLSSTSDDENFNLIQLDAIVVTNKDNDTPGILVDPISTLSTTEDGGLATFSIKLDSQPSDDVVIDIATSDTSEGLISIDNLLTAAVATTSIKFTPNNWSTPQIISLIGQNDNRADGDQTYSILIIVDPLLTTDTSGYLNESAANISVVNIDTTPPPIVFVSSTMGLTTSEAGNSATFSVVLQTPPDGDVALDVVGNRNEGLIASGVVPAVFTDKITISFNVNNWSTPQIITVQGVDDSISDGDTLYNILIDINLTSTNDTTGYALLNPDDVSVLNLALLCEGGLSAPKITGGTGTYKGQTCKGKSYYEVTGLSANTLYNIGLFGLSDSADMSVYSSADFNSVATCKPSLVGVENEYCQASSDGSGKLWIAVDANSSIGGATFILTVDLPSPSEGSINTPLSLIFNTDTPHSGKVDQTISYYQVTGLETDTAYVVNLSQLTGDIQLSVFANNVVECQSNNANILDESCMAISDSTGNLIIQVDGSTSFAGATYQLDLKKYNGAIAEGNITIPVTLAFNTIALPHNGSVNPRSSYYNITGLSANTSYVVTLTGLSDNADLHVLAPGLNGVSCSSSKLDASDEWCAATTADASGELQIQVDAVNAIAGAYYELDIKLAGVSQGTISAPQSITSGITAPYAGSVGDGRSFYVISGLAPGSTYEFNLSGLAGNADLYLYATGAMNNIACQSLQSGNLSEVCALMADSAGNIWLEVDGSNSVGGTNFTLTISHVLLTETELFSQAVSLYDLADYTNAIIKFKELLTTFPNGLMVADSNLYIGRANYQLLDYVQANSYFDLLINNFPGSSVIYDSHYWKGRTLAKQNNILLARSEYQFVVDNAGLAMVAGNASYQLAKLIYDSSNYTQAITGFTQAIVTYGVFDKADNAQYYLAKSYHALNNFAQARTEYNYLIQNYVLSVWVDNAQYQIGKTYYDEAEVTLNTSLYDTALVEFYKVFQYPLASSADLAQYYIGRSYHSLKNYSQARVEYNKVVTDYALSIWSDNAQYQIGKTYFDEAEETKLSSLYDTAIIEFRKVFSYTVSSSSDSAQYYIAKSQQALKKYPEARTEYALLLNTPAYSLSTLLDDAQYQIGKTFYEEAKVSADIILYNSAITEFNKVITLYTSSSNAASAQYFTGRSYHSIANITASSLDYESARAAYNEVSIVNYPTSSFLDDALYQRGRTFYSEANYTAAILEFDKVTSNYATTNSADDALYYKGRSYQKKVSPDLTLARTNFQLLISQFPTSVKADNAQYYMAMSYHSENNCILERSEMSLVLSYVGSIYVAKAQSHIDSIDALTHVCL